MNHEGRAKALKLATHSAHERLDHRIMAGAPFADRERYVRFVKVQHAFHRDLAALYGNAALAALLPDLAGRQRLSQIEDDLGDLGVVVPRYDIAPHFGAHADVPTALGWLYVAEGSNLGAAFLLKEAEKLGLDEMFGARHLAAAPEGRGAHWRSFTAALDAVTLSAEDEQRAIAGATAAFTRVAALVDEHLAVAQTAAAAV
ncbi:MAG: biliverdin-producing heme oxygenase [Proteobacteria bacterium]|nr:biliverdin-producing heme oxygenase [Pseudomonadota bacterium]